MIHSIRVRGFRRYRDASFELRPGVNFIDGPNNAGKTTILYAIEYALFGRVGGFTTQSALLHPGERGMGVELSFTGRDGLRYRLQRAHIKPPRARTQLVGHFTLKRQPGADEPEQYLLSSDFGDTQEDLAVLTSQILGLTPRLFDVAVHLRQGRIASILAGAPELDKVLGVTAAVVAAEEMRALALEHEKQAASLPSLEESRTRAIADVEAAKGEVEAVEKSEAERAERSAKLEAELARVAARQTGLEPIRAQLDALSEALERWGRAEDEVARLEAALDALLGQSSEEAAQASIELATRELRGAEDKRAATAASERELADQRRELDRKLGDLAARIERRAALTGQTTCETCGQTIDAERAGRELATWREEQGQLEAQLAELDRGIEGVRAETASHEASKARAADAEREAKAQLAALQQAKAAVAEASPELAEASEAGRRVAAELSASVEALAAEGLAATELTSAGTRAELDSQTRTFAAALASAREAVLVERTRLETESAAASERAKELKERLEAARARALELAKEQARIEAEVARLARAATLAEDVRVLAAGFKELQVSLRDRAAETLAADTLALHQHLSGGDDELSTVRVDPSKYAVYVTPKDVGEDVPAHLFQGGGHQLLLGLAFKLAVARLVGARSFLLLDEPTYGLDRDRRAALLGRLADLGVAEQLIVITHHDVVGVTGHRVRVVRDGKRSFVEHEQEASA